MLQDVLDSEEEAESRLVDQIEYGRRSPTPTPTPTPVFQQKQGDSNVGSKLFVEQTNVYYGSQSNVYDPDEWKADEARVSVNYCIHITVLS